MENQNRAFMYGESVFTTLRMVDGRLIDWEQHFDRLRKGVEFVFGPFTDGDEWVAIFKNLLDMKYRSESGDKVLRFAVYREQARGHMRSSMISITDLKIQLSSSPFDPSRADGAMLKLRTCPAFTRPKWWPSYLKSGNYLETILAQKVFLKEGDHDLLFLSSDDHVLESSVANIFVIRRNKLYTAPPGPNVLEGVMRKKFLGFASDFFDEVLESASDLEQLYKADAIIGSNSVRGLFLVDRVDEYELTYKQEFLDIFEKLKARVLE